SSPDVSDSATASRSPREPAVSASCSTMAVNTSWCPAEGCAGAESSVLESSFSSLRVMCSPSSALAHLELVLLLAVLALAVVRPLRLRRLVVELAALAASERAAVVGELLAPVDEGPGAGGEARAGA